MDLVLGGLLVVVEVGKDEVRIRLQVIYGCSVCGQSVIGRSRDDVTQSAIVTSVIPVISLKNTIGCLQAGRHVKIHQKLASGCI